ncbi:MAG TPA: LysR family transcriptional regulator [Candidatus Acidoferrales bacterium]|nr:LysR family transcriptional regulator [Candidatus Acidoferrales bacterium]
MKLSQFDLNLLVALDALLTEKNVTRAGMRIHLSQSATSAALARLRNSFQDQLLVRVGGKMVLTPMAQSLVKPVRNLLLQAQATIATQARFEPATTRRRFSVAVSDYATTVFMADALKNLQHLAPHLTFELVPTSERAVEALEAGALDFLIAPEVFASKTHPKMPLFEDTHTVIAWTRNRSVRSKLSLDEYLSLGHVAVHVGEGAGPNFDELFLRRLKYKRRAEVIAHSFDVVPHLVVGTNRIATVATRLARKYARFMPLKLVPLPVHVPPMTEVLQWHKFHDRDTAYVWLRGVLIDQAARLLGPPSDPGNGRAAVDRSKT